MEKTNQIIDMEELEEGILRVEGVLSIYNQLESDLILQLTNQRRAATRQRQAHSDLVMGMDKGIIGSLFKKLTGEGK